ncbi:MAG: hypothetical protein SFW07_05755 [Gammaproteobacteria bacterium]|nr:hypothetical protein [Gammaproteobacteria bacterium]
METNESYTEVFWEDVSESVRKVNPELAGIIDKISPDKSYKLIKAGYSFGDLIVEKGVLQMRNQGKIHPVNSNIFSQKLKEDLLFSPIPLGLLLNKSCEVFITEDDRPIPLKAFNPGMLFGTFETTDFVFGLESAPSWNVSAGSRSIFSLPKITGSAGLKRLKAAFSINQNIKVQSLSDHWELFRKIAENKNFTQKWKCEVIFFTKSWFKNKKNDPAWREFVFYLLSQSWTQSRSSIAKVETAVDWQNFIRTLTGRRLQPTPYMVDTLRHLFLISIGEAPAFKPIVNLDQFAPTIGLQKAIMDIYSLKKYAPFLMHAVLHDKGDDSSLYYSLAYPTLLEGSPDSKTSSSTIMLDTRNLKLLIDTLLGDKEINESLLSNRNFDYFHVEEDMYSEIRTSEVIPKEDKNFNMGRFNGLAFCSTSPFWRGCIRIQFT